MRWLRAAGSEIVIHFLFALYIILTLYANTPKQHRLQL